MIADSLPWALEPPYARLFFVFLVFVCVIGLIRGVAVALALWLPRRRISVQQLVSPPIDADRLARAALARRISFENPPPGSSETESVKEAGRTSAVVAARFEYRWELLRAQVASANALIRVTILATAAVACYDLYPAYRLAYFDTNRTAYAAWLRAGERVLTRAAIGLLVCLALTILNSILEARLIRSRAAWGLFHATARGWLSRQPE